jgi:hypothetical protein
MLVLDIYEVCYTAYSIRVITKLPNSEQSYKGKVKTHKSHPGPDNILATLVLLYKCDTVIVTAGTFEP